MALSRTGVSRLGALIFLVLGLLCAGGAALTVSHMMQAQGYTRGTVVPVVVASHPIKAGQPVKPADVKVVEWPEASKPPGAMSDPAQVFNREPPPAALSGILTGEPILDARLAKSNEGAGVALLVRKNFRAVAVKVNDAVARAGLVYPGAYVDVVATLNDVGYAATTTRLVIQAVRVLAVEEQTDVAGWKPAREKQDWRSSSSRLDGAVVTLELTPEDVEVLAMSEGHGEVNLALRNAEDTKIVATKGSNPQEFLPPRPPVTGPQNQAVPTATKKHNPRRPH